ncbi:hypothetical protein KSP40_PGU009507 [Platanthera guangdongensis]|uniref:Uncharacterized protein n=1 Tax=Platanthera guangdongensis TaxID=2320717 RepID=A0ABR2MKI9_9ASPA
MRRQETKRRRIETSLFLQDSPIEKERARGIDREREREEEGCDAPMLLEIGGRETLGPLLGLPCSRLTSHCRLFFPSNLCPKNSYPSHAKNLFFIEKLWWNGGRGRWIGQDSERLIEIPVLQLLLQVQVLLLKPEQNSAFFGGDWNLKLAERPELLNLVEDAIDERILETTMDKLAHKVLVEMPSLVVDMDDKFNEVAKDVLLERVLQDMKEITVVRQLN